MSLILYNGIQCPLSSHRQSLFNLTLAENLNIDDLVTGVTQHPFTGNAGDPKALRQYKYEESW